MRINKYLPFALIYFFFNSVALPFGLTYTALLSPLFYWWVVTTRKTEILLPFFIILLPFVVIQLSIIDVDLRSYIVSFLNLTAVYIFCQAFYTFLIQCADPEKIFRKLLFINFILCLVAIPFYFTSYYWLFWIQQYLTEGIDNFRRLKLFTYEASYYATLFTPIFFFYFLQIIFNQNRVNVWLLIPLLVLPYILSFALGVIGSMVVAIIFTFLAYFDPLVRRKRVLSLLFLAGMAGIIIFTMITLFLPANTLFIRIGNIFSGEDASGKGRTFDAFTLANMLLAEKSYLWGIGLGQIKIIGEEIIRNFYLYPMEYNATTIPNAAGETLAIFGWVGFCLRLGIEIFLFFYTRVWLNYYRLLLFLFIFIYQFTGSFVTNIAEYVIWILAFTNAFPQFNVSSRQEQNISRN